MPSNRLLPKKKLAHILVRPPNAPSNGAQQINALLGAASKLSRRLPLLRQYKVVVNWGNSNAIPCNGDVRVVNPPDKIGVAVNKLRAMLTMQAAGVRLPEFQETPPNGAGDIWLARTNLVGSGGAGIVVVREGEQFPKAPLYVKYVRKEQEYRLHVAFGQVIAGQLKLRRNDNEQTADQKLIRNHDNGWVFAPRELDAFSEEAKAEAIRAVAALGLDFGAVDLIVGKKDKLPYVLEVNTAPGIVSPTIIGAYQKAFRTELGLPQQNE